MNTGSIDPDRESNRNAAPPPLACPPPMPPPPPGSIRSSAGRDGGDEQFARTYGPLAGPLTTIKVVDSLLKAPGQVSYEIVSGKAGHTALALLEITALCLLLYGFVTGTFAGDSQLWKVPLKTLAGTLFCAAICLPSLYILTSLAGGTQSLAQTAGLLLQSLALGAMLLAGFAPIAWLFSQATGTTVFMGVLHLLVWGTAAAFSLTLLARVLSALNRRQMTVIRFWGVIFFVVLLQMSTTLRPLIGRDDGLWVHGKQFFLQHWGECFRNPQP